MSNKILKKIVYELILSGINKDIHFNNNLTDLEVFKISDEINWKEIFILLSKNKDLINELNNAIFELKESRK